MNRPLPRGGRYDLLRMLPFYAVSVAAMVIWHGLDRGARYIGKGVGWLLFTWASSVAVAWVSGLSLWAATLLVLPLSLFVPPIMDRVLKGPQ